VKDTNLPISHSRPFSHRTRSENLGRLGTESFDLLVIGGGITGAAIARDAALRGISTALVEKTDWAAGTSSRSARLIHGGLRYLEYYQFGLVSEALSERAILRKIAPRLVRPTPFMYPLYRGQEPGFLKLMAGMWVYDLLAQFRNVSRHRMMLARETARREPIVAREGLRGAARYYDAVVDDARLTLATVQSAHLAGAVVANHTRVVGLLSHGGQVVGATARDEIAGREIEIHACAIVNACGPWVDAVRSMDAETKHVSPLLRPTKGVHLIIHRERLTSQHAIAFDSPRDNRHLYVIPWGDFAIIGTTDTDYVQGPDTLNVAPEDVDYLLEAAQHAFPSVHLTEADVISAYAGLRPLIGSNAASTYAISREHHIEQSESGLFTIAGGKLTTHRLMAKEMVDAVAKKVGSAGKCVTGKRHIEAAERAGGTGMPAYQIPIAHLVEAYGADAIRPLAYAEERPELGQPIAPGLPYIRAEVHYAVEHEMALALSDVLIRRTHVIYEIFDAGVPQARDVAALMAEKLGWDAAEQERQVAEYERQVSLTRSFRKT
jgi:glycerol-3-phosphate dehydrogenase